MFRFLCCFILFSSSVAGQAPDSWTSVTLPEAFRSVPKSDLAPIDGMSWYRCLVKVPQNWDDGVVQIHVEALDDARATFVNGTQVGATGTFPPLYRSGLGEDSSFTIPPGVLKAGAWNTVAIRVYQNDPRPNFSVAPPALTHVGSQEGLRLAGVWQYRPGDDKSWATASPSDFREATPSTGLTPGMFENVDQFEDLTRYITRRQGDTDALSPRDAEASFRVPEDLELKLILSEPEIAQPLFMTWDARGRLWVMEYRQYPEIAGVKMLSRDAFLRSVYDSIPQPPPHGAKGRDRISVHEDTDGDGIPDRHSTFVDGLNLASSFAIGRGGVYVTHPPYLLFYPDEDDDGVADGDPEVLLEGFGIEDSHSVINSLRFGPDGWLYGCQGSTVTAQVRKPGSTDPPVQTMGQQIWRYHPPTERFEVFAEGGGNTFGLELDSQGQIFSGHNGGDTRGFHYVQGGYYKKGFGKHGPLSNPYAFGYFQAMKHHSVPRFTHNFVIYEDDVLPSEYRGRLFGIEPLQGQVVMSRLFADQSSYATEDVSRVIQTDDPWFRPVDIKVGPDECLYVADMYEQRIDHSSHYAGRIDRSSGRIYRLQPRAMSPPEHSKSAATDLSKWKTSQLVAQLETAGRTDRQTIQRILGDRQDASVVAEIRRRLATATGQFALELFWALHNSQPEDVVAADIVNHPEASIRKWAVRLLGDNGTIDSATAEQLVSLAAREPSIQVRKQLASTAKRLDPKSAIPILHQLILRGEDVQDLHQPLLIWWALEAQATETGRPHLHRLMADHDIQQSPMMQQYLAERIVKRYAMSGTQNELMAIAELLNVSQSKRFTKKMLAGFEQAFEGRSLVSLPDSLIKALSESGGGSLALRLRQGESDAVQEAIELIADAATPLQDRIQYVQIFGQVQQSQVEPVLAGLVSSKEPEELVSAALNSLQAYPREETAQVVIDALPELADEARQSGEELLSSRAMWTEATLAAIGEDRLHTDDLSDATVRKMLLHRDSEIANQIKHLWPNMDTDNAAEQNERMAEVETLLSAGSGNPKKGKPLYQKTCARCHLLFGEGGQVGPDLTSYQRQDSRRLLQSIISPSLEIREGFESYVVVTRDGRVVTGFLTDQSENFVSLRTVDGQNTVISRDNIDEMSVSRKSIMPAGTLKDLSEQQIRDLFAYLRSSQPVNY